MRNMGSRIGFRVIQKEDKSQIFRQQWNGGVEETIRNTWLTLSAGKTLLDGMQAIRDDLDIGRAFCALIASNYHAPFESIEKDTKCDISDNGLIEIDINDFKEWKVFHYRVDWSSGNLSEKTHVAKMSSKGFKWFVNPQKYGEGL
jgi:hypothetical protein